MADALDDHFAAATGERFAFLFCRTSRSDDQIVFVASDLELVDDSMVTLGSDGWELDDRALDRVVNRAILERLALVEVHNHRESAPRFSDLDLRALEELGPFMVQSTSEPYGALVWGDRALHGFAYFAQEDGGVALAPFRSVSAVGKDWHERISTDTSGPHGMSLRFDRQEPWFTSIGQRRLGSLRVGVVGAGGTGSHVLQQLAFLGVGTVVVVDGDLADPTSLNRLVTATAADAGTPKVYIARRLMRSIAPDMRVLAVPSDVTTPEAMEALVGVDVLMGCVDNDGARLVLNRLALAYLIPLIDIATGILVEGGEIVSAGGRVAFVGPGAGPCLNCMGEIDLKEAGFFLDDASRRARDVGLGYASGLEEPAPGVVSLNGLLASACINELCVLIAGHRTVPSLVHHILIGPPPVPSTSLLTVGQSPQCFECANASQGSEALAPFVSRLTA